MGRGRAGADRARDPKAGKLVGKATEQMQRYGAAGVFLTRWLFPLPGPFVNFVAGATGFSWTKFTIWAVAGERVRVGVCIALGYGFVGNIQAVSDLTGSMLGILAGVAAMAAFDYWLLGAMRTDKEQE